MVIDGADLGRNAPAYCNSTICKYASTFEIVGSKRKEESRNGPRRKRKGAKRKVSRTYIHLGIPSSVPTVVSPLSMIACMSTSTCQLPHYSVSVCCMSKLAKSASLHGCMAAWLHGCMALCLQMHLDELPLYTHHQSVHQYCVLTIHRYRCTYTICLSQPEGKRLQAGRLAKSSPGRV